MMSTYDDAMSMLDARQRYFSSNGFDGSYAERWVKLKAGPVTFYFPNAEGRRRAVKMHDLHHIATGYQTDWTGEAEIAAWEIASGCGRFGWAWVLNLSAMAIGVAIAPRAAFRAFVRGRHSRNLYHQGEFADAMLASSVGAVRSELKLDQPAPPARAADLVAFVGWSLAGFVSQLAPIAALVAIGAALVA